MNLRPAFSGGFRIAATLLLNHSPAACVGLRCCSCIASCFWRCSLRTSRSFFSRLPLHAAGCTMT